MAQINLAIATADYTADSGGLIDRVDDWAPREGVDMLWLLYIPSGLDKLEVFHRRTRYAMEIRYCACVSGRVSFYATPAE